jgi:protein-S-isoprenylcysteine O-methyltransferase Ste14
MPELDRAEWILMLLRSITVVAVFITLVPRTRQLVRLWSSRNGLGAIRRATYIKSWGLLLLALLAIGQRFLPIYPEANIIVWSIVAAGSAYVALLYWQITRHEERTVEARNAARDARNAARDARRDAERDPRRDAEHDAGKEHE